MTLGIKRGFTRLSSVQLIHIPLEVAGTRPCQHVDHVHAGRQGTCVNRSNQRQGDIRRMILQRIATLLNGRAANWHGTQAQAARAWHGKDIIMNDVADGKRKPDPSWPPTASGRASGNGPRGKGYRSPAMSCDSPWPRSKGQLRRICCKVRRRGGEPSAWAGAGDWGMSDFKGRHFGGRSCFGPCAGTADSRSATAILKR